MTPFPVKQKDGSTIPVPCGKCPNCYARRASAWSFRLMQEDKISISSLFITLTYGTGTVPITPKGFMGLCKPDAQKFIKRLRNAYRHDKTRPPVKYFLVGEYGSKKMRPHLHAIIFNAGASEIEAAWTHGSAFFGTVSGASVGYCLKYISKPSKIPLHANDDRLPEFALMSKGLGKNYLSNAVVQWHKKDKFNRLHLSLNDGRKIGMPRYYKEKLYPPVVTTTEHGTTISTNPQLKAIGAHTRENMLIEQSKLPLKSEHQKAAAVAAAFAKMAKTYKENRNETL